MVKKFQKGNAISVSAHFSSVDFDCHCKRPECDFTFIDDNLPPSLDLLWDIMGPFKLDRSFSCEAHNKEIGGAPNSQHLIGKAADCKSLSGRPGNEMATGAEQVPLFHGGGIGTYPTFAHCDVRGWQARWKSGIKPSLIVPC